MNTKDRNGKNKNYMQNSYLDPSKTVKYDKINQ